MRKTVQPRYQIRTFQLVYQIFTKRANIDIPYQSEAATFSQENKNNKIHNKNNKASHTMKASQIKTLKDNIKKKCFQRTFVEFLD